MIARQDAGELWIIVGIELQAALVGEADCNPFDGSQCKSRILDLALAFSAPFSNDAVWAVHADFDSGEIAIIIGEGPKDLFKQGIGGNGVHYHHPQLPMQLVFTAFV